MEIDFIAKAILSGIGIAIIAGPLGCFVTWRRMSYFGDTLAHSALFGVCLSVIFHLNIYLGLITSCVLVVLLLGLISNQKKIANDAILGILSHSMLALGLIMASSVEGARVDLLSYLYGDILTVTNLDLIWILAIDIVVVAGLIFLWNKLINATVHDDLAKIEGVDTNVAKWSLFLLMALVFAVAVKLVGVLLITALLIIPASAARLFSKTPEQMAVLAIGFGILSVILGINSSLWFDWPAGPAIVVINTLIFILIFSFFSFVKKT